MHFISSGRRIYGGDPLTHTCSCAVEKSRLKMLCHTVTLFALCSLGPSAIAATASPLFSRGYTVIPEPQKVSVTGKDLEFSSSWRLDLAPSVKPDDIAVVSLKELLQERFHLVLSETKGKGGPTLTAGH